QSPSHLSRSGAIKTMCACCSLPLCRNCATYSLSPSRRTNVGVPRSVSGTAPHTAPSIVLIPRVRLVSESRLTPCGVRRRTRGTSIGKKGRASGDDGIHDLRQLEGHTDLSLISIQTHFLKCSVQFLSYHYEGLVATVESSRFQPLNNIITHSRWDLGWLNL